MKSLKLDNTYGVRLPQKTAKFQQDGTMEAFTNFLKGFSSNSYRLWGATVADNGTTVTVTAGAINYKGEIMQVDAASFAHSSGTLVYTPVVTYDAAGNIKDSKGNDIQIGQIKKAVVRYKTTETDYVNVDLNVSGMVDLLSFTGGSYQSQIDAINTKLTQGESAWTTYTPTIFGNNASGSNVVFKYKKLPDNSSKTIHVIGFFAGSLTNNSQLAFTLPANGTRNFGSAVITAGTNNQYSVAFEVLNGTTSVISQPTFLSNGTDIIYSVNAVFELQ